MAIDPHRLLKFYGKPAGVMSKRWRWQLRDEILGWHWTWCAQLAARASEQTLQDLRSLTSLHTAGIPTGGKQVLLLSSEMMLHLLMPLGWLLLKPLVLLCWLAREKAAEALQQYFPKCYAQTPALLLALKLQN